LQLKIEEIIKFEKIFQEVRTLCYGCANLECRRNRLDALQIDNSADGKLDLMELLDYLELNASSFARRVGRMELLPTLSWDEFPLYHEE
jgi:hypothetical protein